MEFKLDAEEEEKLLSSLDPVNLGKKKSVIVGIPKD
jgi:hypothetical protein